MGLYFLKINKESDVWVCELCVKFPWQDIHTMEDKVKSTSYSELQIEIGNRNWIDLINQEPYE